MKRPKTAIPRRNGHTLPARWTIRSGRALLLLAFCATTALVFSERLEADSASIPLGSVVKEFRLPQRNSQGELDGVITGREARAISVNRTEIIDMKIDLYDQGKVGTTILSPRCDLWKLENRLSTQSGAVIERPDLRLTSQIMDWEVGEHRGVFRQNVRVVLFHLPLAKPTKQESSGSSAPALRQGGAPALKPLESSP
ncbi:hypothetical protein [Methylacidimicrobium sp. B4]|uniref:hypothetical protein n=1 Tax=Methylacidimicrobium sp. B4 TaxID=2796139 RepID=UPI001A8EE9FE|nr:hypothetical protein [Methylacidimicrobium sp. B4]QSR85147.1 hypothetical protein MacB4_02470 [Methylacidimicrobium sp. B4]